MRIYTATSKRDDVARLWFTAMRATLTTPATLVEAHAGEPTGCADEAVKLEDHGFGNPLYVVRRLLPKDGERAFVEEDIIPVVPWSPGDYPGPLRFLDAHEGAPWPAFTIARTSNAFRPFTLIPQRFVRDGGCPPWLPAELCQPAMDANAKVVGEHFLHIDKLYRQTEYAEQKTALIKTLTAWFEGRTFAAKPGLGDMVAAGLSAVGITKERVTKAIGRPCGCAGRQAALNKLGQKLGLPPGQTPPTS